MMRRAQPKGRPHHTSRGPSFTQHDTCAQASSSPQSAAPPSAMLLHCVSAATLNERRLGMQYEEEPHISQQKTLVRFGTHRDPIQHVSARLTCHVDSTSVRISQGREDLHRRLLSTRAKGCRKLSLRLDGELYVDPHNSACVTLPARRSWHLIGHGGCVSTPSLVWFLHVSVVLCVTACLAWPQQPRPNRRQISRRALLAKRVQQKQQWQHSCLLPRRVLLKTSRPNRRLPMDRPPTRLWWSLPTRHQRRFLPGTPLRPRNG
jgi:hypothetical protein